MWTAAFRARFHDLAPEMTGLEVRVEYRLMLGSIVGISLNEEEWDDEGDPILALAHATLARNVGVVRIYVASGIDLGRLQEALIEAVSTVPDERINSIGGHLFENHCTQSSPDDRLRQLLLPRLPNDFRLSLQYDGYCCDVAPLATAAQCPADVDRKIFWEIYRRRLAAYDGNAHDPRLAKESIYDHPFVHCAVRHHNAPLLRELLDFHRLDPTPITHLREPDEQQTPLFWAGSAEMTRILVDAGADKDARDADGCTPLMRPHTSEAMLELARLGADLHLTDPQGRSLLHHAVENPVIRADTMAALIRLGADPQYQDNSGKTPLDHAVEFQRATADWSHPVQVTRLEGLVELLSDPKRAHETASSDGDSASAASDPLPPGVSPGKAEDDGADQPPPPLKRLRS
jgi:hypothetical protein